MGRFASAKSNSEEPNIIKRALNYLIDLLDQGYSIEATISGKKIVITINANVGIEITINGSRVFGVDTSGNLFASRLASNNSPEDSYVIAGDLNGGGGVSVSLYDLTKQNDYIMAMGETIDGGGNLTGFSFSDGNQVVRIGVSNDGGFAIRDESSNIVFYHNSNGSFYFRNQSNTKNVIEYDSTIGYTIIRNNGVADNGLVVNDTGVYKIIAGVWTAL